MHGSMRICAMVWEIHVQGPLDMHDSNMNTVEEAGYT